MPLQQILKFLFPIDIILYVKISQKRWDMERFLAALQLKVINLLKIVYVPIYYLLKDRWSLIFFETDSSAPSAILYQQKILCKR